MTLCDAISLAPQPTVVAESGIGCHDVAASKNREVSSHLNLLSGTQRLVHTPFTPTLSQFLPIFLVSSRSLPAAGWEDLFLHNFTSFPAISPQCLQTNNNNNNSPPPALRHPTHHPLPHPQEELRNGISSGGKRSPPLASGPHRQAQATILFQLGAPSRAGRAPRVYKIKLWQQ